MSRYKKYKESGHVGIGEVPEHWHVKRMKHLGDAIIGLTYSPNDVIENEEGILVLRSSNIQEGFISFDDCVYVNKEINPTLITRKGDILICARNGSAHLVGKNICIDEKSAGLTFGAFMVVFRGKYWRYLSYFFNSPIFTSQTGMFSTTTINQLTSQTLNNLRIAYPIDEQEQNVICDYLEIQTQKLDQLIANKKAQAEKIKELRQIEINNAVTKGLNPNAEMKDSGIDWLGKIPKHWEVKRLKNVADINTTKQELDYEEVKDLDVVFLPMESVSENGGIDNSEKRKAYELWEGFTYFKRNDVIIAKITPCFENGKGAWLNTLESEFGFGSTEFHTVRGHVNRLDNQYFFFVTKSDVFMKIGEAFMTGSAGQKRVSTNFVLTFKLAFPPIEEQIKIANYLQKRTASIDILIKNVEMQIDKLQELRKIRIYEAVTGKIKVNSYAETTAQRLGIRI